MTALIGKLPDPVLKYLQELEISIKQLSGVVPEAALEDAREFLMRDWQALQVSEPGQDDQALYEHFVEQFGTPTSVAEQYEHVSVPSLNLPGHAPGWRMCCTRCGRSKPAAAQGALMMGAKAWHRYVVGWCRGCKRLSWVRVIQDLNQTNLSEKMGLAQSSKELRDEMHKPWKTLLGILAFVLAIILIVNTGLRLGDWLPTASHPQSRRALSELPEGWEITKQIVVPKHQIRGFSDKLGVEVRAISNQFLSDGTTTLQVNCIETRSQELPSLAQVLRKGKSDPRSVVVGESEVYELMVPTAAHVNLANRARYLFHLQPEVCEYSLEFEVAPILASENDMKWNPLFNAMLQYQSRPNEANESAVTKLASHFEFGGPLQLASTGIGGQTIEWQLASSAVQEDSQDGLAIFAPTNTGKRGGIPVVRVQAKVTCITPAAWPPKTTERTLAQTRQSHLTKASSVWPCQDPAIREVVSNLLGDRVASDFEKVDALLDWISQPQNMRFAGQQLGSRYGCLTVLEQGYGHCWDYSDLFITLCRAVDLPCRQVFGWLVDSSGHVWCEVWIDGVAYHVDPTTGFFCGSDYVPISISETGAVPLLYTSPVNIERTAAKANSAGR